MKSDANSQHANSKNERRRIISGWDQLIGEQIERGMIPYFISFMFNQIPGREETKRRVMTREVERVHDILTRHTVRKPTSAEFKLLRPIFAGCIDFQVRKNKLKDRVDLAANDGMHLNVVALVPPHNVKIGGKKHRRFNNRRSRLRVSLKRHFRQSSRFYLSERLSRIHVTKIEVGTMADYTLKAFKSGRLTGDDILLLN